MASGTGRRPALRGLGSGISAWMGMGMRWGRGRWGRWNFVGRFGGGGGSSVFVVSFGRWGGIIRGWGFGVFFGG